MTTLPRPGPLDTLDGPGTELDLLWDQMADVVEATEAVANAAMPNTASAAGELIAGAPEKTMPVDADAIGLADSEASNVLKKFSWSALKTALQSVFATLSGKSGGQTLIGGTAASETLTLRSTAHSTKGNIILGTLSAYDEATARLGIGTTAPSARVHAVSTTEQLRLGYDDANYATAMVSSAGVVSMTATGGQWTYKAKTSSATLGPELITNGGFTSDLSGWTDSGSSWSWSAGTALHTAGSASALTQNVAVTNGSTYQIEFTITGRTAGSISIALGAVSAIDWGVTAGFTSSAKRTLIAGASGSVALVVTPTSDFNGSLDTVTLKLVTLGSVTPAIVLLDSDGSVSMETRSTTSALQSIAVGVNAQRSLTTGSSDTAIGVSAPYSLTTGSSDTAIVVKSQ